MKSFEKAQAYVETLIPTTYESTKALRLERIKLLLKLLGHPERGLRFIHVGGTAGKGSTATIIAQLLSDQGFKVGLHISPHLQSITERAQINRKNISEAAFTILVKKLRPFVEEIGKGKYGKPTYFEMLVALAFEHFREERVDFAVVEVGLGGSLDATNVIQPLVSVLTNVGLDHTEILGDTVEKIATDKAGIIKKGIPVITAATQTSVRKIFADKAASTNSSLYTLGQDFGCTINNLDLERSDFNFFFKKKNLTNLIIPSGARFEVTNTTLALATLFSLEKSSLLKINGATLRQSLSQLKVPGRFEIVSKKPLIILDGAHNPMKMENLISSLDELLPNQKFNFLLAFKRGKNISEMLSILIPLAKNIILTEFSSPTDTGKNTATSVSEVAILIQKDNLKKYLTPSANTAFKKASDLSLRSGSPLVVTGSLYLVGEVRSLLMPD